MKDSYTFYDPNHGGCLRTMRKIDNNYYVINGAYGSDDTGSHLRLKALQKIIKILNII